MGELEGVACAMKSSQNLLLLLAFFAFACGQPRSARQDEVEEKTEAAETLIEENLEVAVEETPGDIDDSEESDLSKGTSEPEPEPRPETEPEPEGSAANSDEKLEESDDMGQQQTNTSKKCQKCFRSAFRARHSEFCGGCEGTSSSSEAGAKPLEKDADRLRRKCRRCSNSKFAEKHQNFCTLRCKDLQQSTTSSEPTPTPEPEHRPITSEDLKKKKKSRRKGQRRTNKKKDVKLPEEETSSSQTLSIPLKDPIKEQELGPLENLIKYIINQK